MERSAEDDEGVEIDSGAGVGGIGLGVDSVHCVMNRHEVKKRSVILESRKIFFI
jgi:hypothetical protein